MKNKDPLAEVTMYASKMAVPATGTVMVTVELNTNQLVLNKITLLQPALNQLVLIQTVLNQTELNKITLKQPALNKTSLNQTTLNKTAFIMIAVLNKIALL